MNRLFRSTLLALVMLSFALVARAQTYDANTAFVPGVTNPNGVWSYGYTDTLGGTFHPFDEYNLTSDFIYWRANTGIGIPGLYKNISGGTINGIDPGQIALHPGANDEYAVLRFTVPTTNFYNLYFDYFTGHYGNTDLALLWNNVPYITVPSTTGGGAWAFGSSTPFNAGDTLDLAIGTGGDGYFGDFTPVEFRAVAYNVTPESSSLPLFAGALLPCGFFAWRRLRIRKQPA